MRAGRDKQQQWKSATAPLDTLAYPASHVLPATPGERCNGTMETGQIKPNLLGTVSKKKAVFLRLSPN